MTFEQLHHFGDELARSRQNSVIWNISFSKYIRFLEPYFEKYSAEYSMLQQYTKEFLQKEDDLRVAVQMVGRDSVSEDQKCTLEVAEIIREVRWGSTTHRVRLHVPAL